MKTSLRVSDHLTAYLRHTPVPTRFLSHDACLALTQRLMRFAGPSISMGEIFVDSQWTGDLRWARNRAAAASDRQTNRIAVTFTGNLGSQGTGTAVTGSAYLNQIDDRSLQAAVRMAIRHMNLQRSGTPTVADIQLSRTTPQYRTPPIWSDATYAQSPATRGEVVRRLITGAEQAGMLSAGYVAVTARGVSYYSSDGVFLYEPRTTAQCSLTVRDPQGTGSGWAGESSYDWGRFDAAKLAAIALDKCLRSRNPVRLEPGRYTAILEPQATYDMISQIMNVSVLPRTLNEYPPDPHPFYEREEQIAIGKRKMPVAMSKLGEQVLDERITISHDPMDPDLGVIPFTNSGEPYRPVTWIDKGVLVNLPYDRNYAVYGLRKDASLPFSGAFRMSGGTASLDDMIATTQRGLLITRFWDIRNLEMRSLLSTGVTRDGLWLIENGKISHPVKNFRITESPLFIFNNVEQLGIPVPVFSPDAPAIVPPVKVRDFSFTSLSDAV